MEKFVLTPEFLKNARSYVPISAKRRFAETCAPVCMSRVEVTLGKHDEDNVLALPNMFEENAGEKSRVLLGALVVLYLRVDGEDDLLLSEEKFDYYAGSHILSQLERLKADKDVRDMIFDLLADYRELARMLSVEICGQLNIKNDLLVRAALLFQQQITPEFFTSLTEKLEQAQQAAQETYNGLQFKPFGNDGETEGA